MIASYLLNLFDPAVKWVDGRGLVSKVPFWRRLLGVGSGG